MRVDINLATQPYEDSGSLWMRWGTALAALGLITLVLLYSVLAGWAAARKDRSRIAQREQQIAVRDQEKARAEAIPNLPENRATPTVRNFLTICFCARHFPGPKFSRIWNG